MKFGHFKPSDAGNTGHAEQCRSPHAGGGVSESFTAPHIEAVCGGGIKGEPYPLPTIRNLAVSQPGHQPHTAGAAE